MCVRKLFEHRGRTTGKKVDGISTGLTPAKTIHLIYKNIQIQKYNTKICSTKQEKIPKLAPNKKLPDKFLKKENMVHDKEKNQVKGTNRERTQMIELVDNDVNTIL